MLSLREATESDVPLILSFIRGLAEYEKLSHEVEATEDKLRATLFPADGKPAAECVLASYEGKPAGHGHSSIRRPAATGVAADGLVQEAPWNFDPACAYLRIQNSSPASSTTRDCEVSSKFGPNAKPGVVPPAFT